MARYKKFIDANVLDEAKKRLHHIYELHDDVVVSFSGGKDSLVVLHLTKEVAFERGLKKVRAVFRDEELIHQEVIDFVHSYMDKDWLDLEHWAIPLQSNKYVLGKPMDYVQWDNNREWIREKPEWALTAKDLGIPDSLILSQHNADELAVRNIAGKACILTGVRAAESLMRYRSVVNKLNENYINASSTQKATLGRPIYDWQENDVFKYLYDNEIKYCSIYDSQLWGGRGLRVASAISTEAAKMFDKLPATDPELYDRVVAIFPEMFLQERYFKELDKTAALKQYGQSWDGIYNYITEHIKDPKQLGKALKEFSSVKIRAAKLPDLYPIEYVFKCFLSQGGERTILPQKKAVKNV
jgi:predicted phosphoadenosine phosphosulfate sulfurtransferase